ncbi:hypothetical protein [Sphingosinicella sp. BN140058]|uniref:DUF6894 family protein n=1 Tax=Sphingosinicella sp. BN140058 TaxID=1892855 RepID=UPI001010732F|nr:hypothetical protein [Sphingosinicella sp. BN140058]QAY75420.1 hypothetical protein ETR14_01910 [Sphingosinicella sp. BN140058]
MPHFYFHFENQGVQVKDEHGLQLPDAEAAWYQAVRSARDLIRAERTIGCGWSGQWVQIEDEGGVPVDRIPLEEIARYAGGV